MVEASNTYGGAALREALPLLHTSAQDMNYGSAQPLKGITTMVLLCMQSVRAGVCYTLCTGWPQLWSTWSVSVAHMAFTTAMYAWTLMTTRGWTIFFQKGVAYLPRQSAHPAPVASGEDASVNPHSAALTASAGLADGVATHPDRVA